ncbi:MAG: IS30 family transposase [Clostridium sp.]|nr:IS30 family transposase [Clostridium sp.]
MKQKGTKNLSYIQRLMLEDYLKEKLHKKEIAKKLGVCLATIYNEIKRGEYLHKERSWSDCWGEIHYKNVKRYSPNKAQKKYELNMTSKGAPIKLGNDYAFVDYVEKRVIKDKLSPCAVLGEIKRKQLFKTNISKTTLYRYISKGIFLHLRMKHLPIGERKKHYRKPVAKRPPKGTSIEKRPNEISQRNSFGHWEMDCVVGKKETKDTLLVLTERLTRYEKIIKIPNRKTQSVVQVIDGLEKKYGQQQFKKLFKSITVDNGVEFSDFEGLEKSVYDETEKRTNVYYCHPYTSCERGTNERINRDIRRQAPKGTDFTRYSNKSIQFIEDWVNAYPREIFGFATSKELFEKQLQDL